MKNLLLKVLLFLFISMFSFKSEIYSQQMKLISGKIIDANTNQGLPYCNLYICATNIGSITNDYGEFKFWIDKIHMNDTLTISYIGYSTENIPISLITDTAFLIQLSPTVIDLPELEISALSAEEIVKESMKNVKNNYDSEPMMLRGYYRELIREKEELHKYAEGVVDIYRQAGKYDQISLIQGRKKEDLAKMEVHKKANPVLGGPNSCIKRDIYKYWRFLRNENISHYDFKIDGFTTYEQKLVYIISFDRKGNSKNGFYKGIIYIDKDSKAIVKIQYGYNDYGIEQEQASPFQLRLMKLFAGLTLECMSIDVTVNYTYVNSKWYLKSVRYNNVDKLSRKGIEYTYITERELMISEIRKQNIKPLLKSELLNGDKDFSNQVGDYDDKFWENYNVITASDSLRILINNIQNNK